LTNYTKRRIIKYICLWELNFYLTKIKKIITPEELIFAVIVLHIAVVLVSGVINILYSLTVSGVSAAAAVISSCTALAVYITGSYTVYRFRYITLAGFGVAFWFVTLTGIVFYSMFNIFNIAIDIAVPNMTAFLRFMMTLLTLPLLAVNFIITSIPNVWAAFAFVIIMPMAQFILYLILFIKIKRTAKTAKTVKDEKA
jgi:hypothetical protein